jgi:hypothetical protein
MLSTNHRVPEARRARLDQRLQRLKASTVGLTVAAAISLWWLVGGAVAETQGLATPTTGPPAASGSSATENQAQNPFFSDQQPSLGSAAGNGSSTLRSGGS